MESTNNRAEMKQSTETDVRAMPKSKRPYQTPLLRDWGSVAGLTRAGSEFAYEGYGGSLNIP